GRLPDEGERAGRDGNAGRRTVEDEFSRRRAELEQALAGVRKADAEAPGQTGSVAGFATSLRLSSEFIAAILVGAAIGWLIDSVAGTLPWGMIVFLLLGFCAGILNVLRSAGML